MISLCKNIINGIHKIRGKTSVNILVSNYTIKHITFNKGEYTGHLEPTLTDDMPIDQPENHSAHSVTLQKMMAEQVQPDIFDLPCHKLQPGIQSKLEALLEEYETQFAKEETSISITSLTEMTTRYWQLWSHITETISYSNEELPMGKRSN